MTQHRVQKLFISCCFLLLLTCNQFVILGSAADTTLVTQANYKSEKMSKATQTDPPATYGGYIQDTLDILLNSIWDSETKMFFDAVGQNGTATLHGEFKTYEQATIIKALAYAYPRIENQTQHTKVLDRMTTTVDTMVTELWDEDGAVVSAYPPENNPVRFALFQSLTISALIAAQNQVGGVQYLPQVDDTLNFLLQTLWDDKYGGFYYGDFNGTTDTSKDTQSQAMAISGLISAYNQYGNTTYLTRARQTAEFTLTNLWDSTNRGFYDYADADGTIPDQARTKRIVTQGLMVRALSELYTKDADNRYINYINQTINFSMDHLWDPAGGGFFAYSSEDGLVVDDSLSKAPNKQFYMILGLMEAFEAYRIIIPEYTNYLYSIALETLDFVLSTFWDNEYGGFYIAVDMMGEIQTTDKYAIPQALGVEVLLKMQEVNLPAVTNMNWNPIAPTPLDQIKFSVSTFGQSSIDTIALKYSLDDETIDTIPMDAHSYIADVFETKIGPFPNGTMLNAFVWANDSHGEEFYGITNKILVTVDIIGPEVNLVGTTPSTPMAGEVVIVTAHSLDDRPQVDVKQVTITYREERNEWITQELDPVGDDLYNVTIGPFTSESTIEFYFTGSDEFGNSQMTDVWRISIAKEQRTIDGFDWMFTLFALASLFSLRYYVFRQKKYE